MELLTCLRTSQHALFLPELQHIIPLVRQQANPGNLHKAVEPFLHQGTQLIQCQFLPCYKGNFSIFYRISLYADFVKFIQRRKYGTARFLFHQIALVKGKLRRPRMA